MNSKRLAIGLGVVILAGLLLFVGIQNIAQAKSRNANAVNVPAGGAVYNSSNDVGAGAPRPNPLPVTGSYSSSNDVGAGAPRIAPLPVTGRISDSNDVGTYRIMRDNQLYGWRDAGAGSQGQ